ncbi:hypothetical protein GWI33_003321 [Rhynchophorus ferrugineus]|uniref:Uncharacterized protein n=1 Tax=Rhynchophorus ferrugineus TaxID=354439 RepID=A0A834IQ97_RHYFE|nr:hypothetical protein GWI33_003321 [Rhynchophorus ferrugineus]
MKLKGRRATHGGMNRCGGRAVSLGRNGFEFRAVDGGERAVVLSSFRGVNQFSPGPKIKSNNFISVPIVVDSSLCLTGHGRPAAQSDQPFRSNDYPPSSMADDKSHCGRPVVQMDPIRLAICPQMAPEAVAVD